LAVISEVLRDHTARAHAATAVLSDRLRFFIHVPPRALWLECGQVEKEKNACPIPAESRVAVCMPAASKEAIQQHQAGKCSGEDVAKGGPLPRI
jgi:hypothetical protein